MIYEVLKKSVTTTAAAYTSGDSVGGLLTIPGPSLPGGAFKIVSATLVDAIKQNAAVDLLFLSEVPGSTSVFTDNLAVDVKAVDFDKVIGSISFLTNTAYKDLGTISAQMLANQQIVCKAPKLNGPVTIPAIYAVLIARATPTYGAATVLELVLGIEQI